MDNEPHKLNASERAFGLVAIIGLTLYGTLVLIGCIAVS